MVRVFDQLCEIRAGTDVGIGAPQFAPRRGFFAGASKDAIATEAGTV